ncbi:MAG: ribosome maturation factor RimM [Gaiella sp.]
MPSGRVGRPHGTDGAFVVEEGSDDQRRWEPGAQLLVDGQPATVEASRRVGRGRVAIRLDRRVERGVSLAIRRSDLPPPEPDSWYAFELVGLRVREDGGRDLGLVAAVVPGVANDNLELDDGTLVPLVGAAVRDVDLETGVVLVTPGFLG